MNSGITAGVPIIWVLIPAAYLLGSIPFGYILVRLRSGRDIRAMGSGNIGATNVVRSDGWWTGAATLLLDVAKGFLAVSLVGHFSGGNVRYMMYAGFAAILGHVFPIWLGFAGGKGVAAALGVFLVLCWPAALLAITVFLIVVGFWRYVSLASVSAVATLPLFVYVLYAPRHAPPVAVSAITLLISVLIVVKHRANIERLIAGKEPQVQFGRKKS